MEHLECSLTADPDVCHAVDNVLSDAVSPHDDDDDATAPVHDVHDVCVDGDDIHAHVDVDAGDAQAHDDAFHVHDAPSGSEAHESHYDSHDKVLRDDTRGADVRIHDADDGDAYDAPVLHDADADADDDVYDDVGVSGDGMDGDDDNVEDDDVVQNPPDAGSRVPGVEQDSHEIHAVVHRTTCVHKHRVQ